MKSKTLRRCGDEDVVKAFCVVFLAATAATAQNIQPVHNRADRDGLKSAGFPVAIENLPFSGTAVTTRTPLVGTPETMATAFYRDAQGRTRIEERGGGADPWSAKLSSLLIRITDPVSGVAYLLDTSTHTAIKSKLRALPPVVPSLPSPQTSKLTTTTDLGTRTIMGLECTGTQTSKTLASGPAGNGQPLIVNSQQWYSPDLQIVIARTISDPNRGEIAFSFTSILRAPPNPTLFAPSSEFTIRGPGGVNGSAK